MFIPRGLRLRFVVAVSLLVLTTVTASAWTFFALSRLSGIVTDTVRQSESVTAVTSRLAGALEREDDAVLLILAGGPRGSEVLTRERAVVRCRRSWRRIGARQTTSFHSPPSEKAWCSITSRPIRSCAAPWA